MSNEFLESLLDQLNVLAENIDKQIAEREALLGGEVPPPRAIITDRRVERLAIEKGIKGIYAPRDGFPWLIQIGKYGEAGRYIAGDTFLEALEKAEMNVP